jgi:alanyl-tRNA synthetase
MKRRELIKKYIDFFKSKNHVEIKNSSLIPENDPTVLFTTAGMHPLIPFLLGEKHPQGKRLVGVQKCIRTGDIEDVGDEVHHTFFEMLGNWSLGDYFKKEAIEMSFEFLTKHLNIPINKLAVTCFQGDKDAEKDNESAQIWISLGIPKERIAFLPKKDNWWGPAGETGPCGPDTEMFYYVKEKVPKTFNPEDKNWVEIWNDVLMEYNKTKQGAYEKAKQQNIDTGMGVERTLAVLNNLDDNYQTSIFQLIIKQIEKLSNKTYNKNQEDTRAMRIIADHIRASVFILGDEKAITPSNIGQGYVLRRLIRRAIRYGKLLNISSPFTSKLIEPTLSIHPDYKELHKNKKFIIKQLNEEEEKFNKTLEEGLKLVKKLFSKKIPIKREKYIKLMKASNHQEILKNLWEKKRLNKDYSIKEANISEKEIDNATITGKEGFLLFQSYGFPAEMIIELATEYSLLFHRGEFRRELQKHQELSRTSSAGMFKSGLSDNTEQTTKLHTATHLLNQALRKVINPNINQKGSNITPERLRFDYNVKEKPTEHQLKQVEDLVNQKIKAKLNVKREELPLNEAFKQGAKGIFGAKYPSIVSVYTIEEKSSPNGFFSKEICTGPHVSNTKELGHFKIQKEESLAAGIRRIRAVLE